MATYNPYEGRGETVKVKYFINLPPDLKVTASSLHLATPVLQRSEDYYSRGEPVALLVSSVVVILFCACNAVATSQDLNYTSFYADGGRKH